MNDHELALLKKAMMLEDDGAEYYFQQSQQWHEKQVSENFLMLSKEEALHSEWLRALFEAKRDPYDAKVLSYLDVAPPKIYDWSDIIKISDLTIKDVFKKAMAMEEASYQYYQEIKSKAEDSDLIKLLEILIEWEVSHYKSFKAVYDAL